MRSKAVIIGDGNGMGHIRERISFYWGRIKAGRLRQMRRQTIWIYGYAKRYWAAMIFYTLLGLVGTAVSLASSLVSKDLVNIITGHQTGLVIRTFAVMIGLTLGTTIMNQVSSYASSWISMKVDSEIKSDIFSKILVTDWESLTTYHTGDLLTRWSADASNISSGVLNFIPNTIIYVFRFISALWIVVYHDPTFAVFALLSMPVSIGMSRFLMRKMTRNNMRSAAMNAKMTGFNQETFSNIQTIKAFDLIGLYIERLQGLQKEYIRMKLDFQKMSIAISILMTTVGLAVSYSTYAWGIYRVWSGAIDYGTMTMFLSLSGTLSTTLQNLTTLVPTAIGLTTSAGRLMDIVEMPREDYGENDQVEELKANHKADGIGIHLEGVDYSYLNGSQVFRGACLEARPHEIVALVGPSGEGKTTMLRLLLSLMKLGGGSAYVCGGNGQDMVSLTPSTRKLFSYVPQGNTMFSGTVAQNMRNVKEDATDEEIEAALRLACAWEFVEKMPQGINSELKERGGGISEGQAQRLSIARALIRNSPILLLDEATSALDVATERRVLKNIMADQYPRTCIVTTHRPTVLGMCNRVYAIRDKECVELGDDEIDKMVRDF
jgi:ABC-type multidrug transport system fused ATPase/permease subunit